MRYRIYELIGENCMTQQAGQQIYNLIHPKLQAGQPVELDFTRVRRFLSVFFNFALGQLLCDIKAEDLDRLLTTSNLNPVGQQACTRVLENASHYYSDATYRKAVDEMLQEQSLC